MILIEESEKFIFQSEESVFEEAGYEKSGIDFRNYILDIDIYWCCICHYKSRASECRVCGNSGALVHDLLWLLPQQEIE